MWRIRLIIPLCTLGFPLAESTLHDSGSGPRGLSEPIAVVPQHVPIIATLSFSSTVGHMLVRRAGIVYLSL